MRLKEWLNESGLGGKSRSGGMLNWDFYIVKNFDKNKEHEFNIDTKLYDREFNIIGSAKKKWKINNIIY